MAVAVRADGEDRQEVDEDYRGRFADAYRTQMQAWVDALADGGPQGPTAWDGYAAAAVGDACVEALHSGRREEVRLAQRPGLYDTGERAVAGKPVSRRGPRGRSHAATCDQPGHCLTAPGDAGQAERWAVPAAGRPRWGGN
jgi:hypothetical protein